MEMEPKTDYPQPLLGQEGSFLDAGSSRKPCVGDKAMPGLYKYEPVFTSISKIEPRNVIGGDTLRSCAHYEVF